MTEYGDIHDGTVTTITSRGAQRVGVAVSAAHQPGWCDIELFYPELICAGGGRPAPLLTWEAEAESARQTVLAKIDAVMMELRRLREALEA